MATPEDKAKRAIGAAAGILPLLVRLEFDDDDGRVNRATLLGVIPVFNREWPMVKRIRARREARRRDAR